MKDLNNFAYCPNCGSTNLSEVSYDKIVTCTQCQVTFRIPVSSTPAPETGRMIFTADFAEPDLPGWKILNQEHVRIERGDPIEMVTTLPKSDLYQPVLRTRSPFDDFDLGVTLRFIKGDREYVHAGIEFRSGDEGDYVISISAQGTFRIGWHDKTEWGDTLYPWSTHPALQDHWGDANRMRLITRGDRIQLYLNGVFAASIRDPRFPSGLIRLVVAPKKKKTTLALSRVELRQISYY